MNRLLKNKKIIIMVILLVLLVIIAPIAYSLFSDVENDEKSLEVGKVKVVLEEDPEWEENEDEFGIKKYTKSVKGVSVEEQDAYVRVRCIPVVEYYKEGATQGEGEWIAIPISQDEIIVTIDSQDWVVQGDYWYYNKVLKGLEETESINIDWKILNLPSEVSEYQIRTDVRVLLEYAQATNNMWKDIFQIEDLPAEVERIQ